MQCADPRGDRVRLLVIEPSGKGYPELLTVGEGTIERRSVGRGSVAWAVDDGFLVLDGRPNRVSLALVRPDGKRSTLV